MTAAAVFHDRGLTALGDDSRASTTGSAGYLGSGANVMFGIALLASGLSSSSVGTLAGQVVMQGFVRRQIPLTVRRGSRCSGAGVIAAGVDPYRSLVISQVVLSFGIPFALIPLVLFCRDRSSDGRHS